MCERLTWFSCHRMCIFAVPQADNMPLTCTTASHMALSSYRWVRCSLFSPCGVDLRCIISLRPHVSGTTKVWLSLRCVSLSMRKGARC